MRPSKYYILISLSIILCGNPAISQDFDKYREIFNSDNFDTIVNKADKFWDKIDHETRVNDENYKGYLRWKSFMKPRIGSFGNMEDYGNVVYSYYSKPVMGRLKSASGPVVDFEYLGPKGIPWTPGFGSKGSTGKGWVNRIVVFKNDTNHILAGTHNAGLWETTDGGDSWQHLTKDYPLIRGIKSIAINPKDSSTYYLLTGTDISGKNLVYSNGLFKSTDGGSSWSYISIEINDSVYYPSAKDYNYPQKIIIHPDDTSNLFLLTDEFIIESTDAGNSWEIIYYGDSSNIMDIEFDSDSSNIIYASGAVILRSRDSGESWDSITKNVTGLEYINRSLICVHDSFPGKVWFYCDTNVYNSGKKLVRYSGGTYTVLHTGSIPGNLTMNCEISPVDSNEVYLGGADYYSYKYEADPTPVFKKISIKILPNDSTKIYGPFRWVHADVRDIKIINNGFKDIVYYAHDGGVSWGIDNGTCYSENEYYCWQQISDDGTDGLYITEFYGLAGVESDPDLLIGGTQDLSAFVYDNGVWKHSCGGDVGKSVIDYMDTEYSYVTSSFNGYLYRLKNRGIAWDSVNLLSPISGYLWNPIILNPVNPHTLFFGHNNLIRINNAKLATSGSVDLDNISPDNLKGCISAIGISKADTNTIYVASTKIPWSSNYTDSIMWRSDNYGATWTPVNFDDSIKNTFGWSYVTDMVVNPDDEDELWICFGNSSCDSKKVYHSANGGADWNVLNIGYPANIPAHCIEYDKISKLLYVGTDVGIYFWDTDDPSSWNKLDDDFNYIVSEIVINKTYGELRVATYGNGIWETDLPLCFKTGSGIEISNTQSWVGTRTLCDNLSIVSGGWLTINGTVYMEYSKEITVFSGGTLELFGEIKNADITVKNGGTLNITYDGKLILDPDDNITVETGGILNYYYGTIEIE